METRRPVEGHRTTGPRTRTKARTGLGATAAQTPAWREQYRSGGAPPPQTAHVLRHRRRPLARSMGLLSPEPEVVHLPHSPLRRCVAPLSGLRRRRRERRALDEAGRPAVVRDPPSGGRRVPSGRPGRVFRVGPSFSGRGRTSTTIARASTFRPRPPSPITPARETRKHDAQLNVDRDGSVDEEDERFSEVSGNTRESQSPRNEATVWDAPLLTGKPCAESWRLLRALTMHGEYSIADEATGSAESDGEESAAFQPSSATKFIGQGPSEEALGEAFGWANASLDSSGYSERSSGGDASFLSGSTRSGADAVSGRENESDDDIDGDARSAASAPLSPRTMRKEQVFDAIRRNDGRAVMDRLIHGDAHVSDRDAESHTLLHAAAQEGLFRMVHMLVRDFHAPLDETDISGNTALHLAGAQGRHRVAHFLRTMGADDSLRNGAGYTCDELRAEL